MPNVPEWAAGQAKNRSGLQVAPPLFIEYDPLFADNVKPSTQTVIPRIIYDSAGSDRDADWTTSAGTIYYRVTPDSATSALNGEPVWTSYSLDAAAKATLPSNTFSGIIEAEVWTVLNVAMFDPTVASGDKAGGPYQYGSDTAITIYPTSDLGGGNRSLWLNFGVTTRYEVTDAMMVSAGFDAPALEQYHVLRERVTGTVGAGNATVDVWLGDGYPSGGSLNHVNTFSGLTSGWISTPNFWSTNGINRTWKGRLALHEVYSAAGTDAWAEAHYAEICERFGWT